MVCGNELVISTVSSTAAQASVKGISFSDAIKEQGTNILVGAVANVGAKHIGVNYKTSAQTGVDKAIQLTSHAALGAGVSALTGNDALSGAVGAVVGEVVGEKLYGRTYLDENGGTAVDPLTGKVLRVGGLGLNAEMTAELASLAGGMSAIFTGNAIGLSDSEVSDNIFSGQRIAKNAVENNLTLFVHGTKSSPKDADQEFINALEETFGEDVEHLDWAPGKNYRETRIDAAKELKNIVENHQFQEGEPLNIITHSHGGNVFKEFTQIYEGDQKVDTSVFLGTPHRDDHVLNYNALSPNANLINVYDKGDWLIQDLIGGIDFKFPYVSDINPSKTISGYNNIESHQGGSIFIDRPTFAILKPKVREITFSNGVFDSHINIDSKDIWNGFVKPNLKEND